MRFLALSGRDVQRLLPMQQCIRLMEDALASLARGEVILPLRPVLRIPDSPNLFALMPAYSSAIKAAGAKLITVFPGNHGTALDSHQGAVLLFDGSDGRLLAMMDAASITAIRTAAVSAVATKLLATAHAKTLAILGSGVQARTHVAAMLAVRPFSTVRVWSRSADRARALVDSLGGDAGASMRVAATAQDAVSGADVICTVTASREPVLRGAWLSPGAHVNAVGASIPAARELDSDAVRRGRVFVDRRESALAEAGDILIPLREGVIADNHIVAEIGAILTGSAEGRRDAKEITLFKSLGLAIEDLVCADYLHRAATEAKAGTWVDL